MANTIRIKRRASGVGNGAPSGLANAELAYNEGDNILYYGYGTGGAGGTATQVIPIAGSGSYLAKTYNLSDLNNLQTARNNLASNTVTSGLFMRGNGTNVLMGNIIASDVPTLNQSTTGSAGSVTSSLTINNGGAGDSSGSTFNGSSAKTISYNSIGAPSISGANATGTWNISVSGNASTVTSGVYTSRTLTAGSGLVGGGDLSSDKIFNIGQGDGISVSADSIAVDNTVVRSTSINISGYIPTWAATNGQTLNVGYQVSTSLDTNNSPSFIPRADAVKTYVDNAIVSGISTNDAMVFKGAIDCSTNPNYPAADRGWTYKVSVAGKIGGASGPAVEVNDTLICTTDGTSAGTHAVVGSNWVILQTNIADASILVTGPTSATSGNIALFDGTTGKIIKDAGFAATTVGQNLVNLTNPSAITFLKVNANNTVSTESASTYRTSLGATTVGSNLFTLTNPSGVSFVRMNADNTVTSRSASELKTDLTLNNVENTALSTWAGSTNLATLGTVATGTWSATTIAVNKGGTGQTSYASGELLIGNASNTLTKATLTQGSNITITNGNGSITIAATDTATAADDILDGSNTGTQITYAPYASNQAASTSPRFYNTSDNPSGSGRLNISAYFYATRLFDNGSRVVTAATICSDAADCTWDGGSF